MTTTTVGGTYISLSTSIIASVILTIFYSVMIILLIICLIIAVYQIHKTIKAKKQLQAITNDKRNSTMP